MTFSPAQAGIQDGTDYFTSIGILGGSTGMAPLISANKTMPAVDAYSSNLTVAVTDSVLKYTQAGTDNKGMSWNLGATYSKALAVAYFQFGTSTDIQGLVLSEDAPTGSQATQNYLDNYMRILAYSYGSETRLQKRISTTYTTLASDTTIVTDNAVTSPAYGMAIYAEVGDPGVQKIFYKFGSTSQWIQIASGTDGALTTGFQSVGVDTGYSSGQIGRMISPFYVWGAS